jgi:phage/plasmid-like protein (TIGR03299 family)
MPAYFDMGFCVRKPSWHGEEVLLDDHPTLEEARLIAHPWEPVREKLFRRNQAALSKGLNDLTAALTLGNLTPEMLEAEFNHIIERSFGEAEGFDAIVRDDNDALLHVAKDSFGLFPNYGLYEIMEVFLGQGALIETGGTVNGGRQVYLLAYLPEPFQVPGDTSATYPFLAILNAHDGTSALRLLPTNVRVVCWNTFNYASLIAEQTGVQYTFKHTASVKERVEEAKTALSQVRVQADKYLELATELTGLTVDDDALADFLVDFLPSPEEHGEQISDRVRENILVARKAFKQIYLDSATTEGIRGTGYGLFQAAGEYLDHIRGYRNRDTYLGRTVLSADRNKVKALELVRRVAR